MIIFNLLSLQYMGDNDTINWKEKTITIQHNIKLIHITLNHYPEYTYKSSISKKNQEIVYDWNKFIKYWNKTILEYTKVFNIEFDKFILDIDYSLAPLYITNDKLFIGIFIINNKIINTIKDKIKDKDKNIKSYMFLSRIEPYLLNTKKNNNNNNNNKSNKYNFFYGILTNSYSYRYSYINSKEYILEMLLDTKQDLSLKIKVNCILQNSMNYLPKLEINRIKKISQNPLNP